MCNNLVKLDFFASKFENRINKTVVWLVETDKF